MGQEGDKLIADRATDGPAIEKDHKARREQGRERRYFRRFGDLTVLARLGEFSGGGFLCF